MAEIPAPPAVMDPEIAAARAAQAAAAPPPAGLGGNPAQVRRAADAAAMYFVDGGPPLARVEAMSIPGPAGPIRARLYAPHAGPVPGGVLYLHGGGWFNCSIDTHDRTMRCLARDSGLAVVGIDYRLAPEHPFPAGLDDAVAAWRWLVEQADALGIAPDALAVAGDSAGAALALALCLHERDAGRPLPVAGALLYGCFAPEFDTDSHRANGDGRFGLTTERMRWYWQSYLGGAEPGPLSAPLTADLTGLPPLHVGLAQLDCLADESRRLAQQLTDAGVPVDLVEWPGAGHGFIQLTRDSALARRALETAARFLGDRIAPSGRRARAASALQEG